MNLTRFDAALKEIYAPSVVTDLAMRDQPALALMPKADVFYGDTYVQPLQYTHPQGRSAVHSSVEGNKDYSRLVKFVITNRAKEYAAVNIDAETIMASSRDVGAFLSARKMEIDGILKTVGRALGKWVVGDGSAALGLYSSGTTTVTLVTADDAYNFEVGMKVTAVEPSTGLSRGVYQTITAVDAEGGTFTIGATLGATANDLIVQAGDNSGAALTTSTAKVGMGIGAWLPSSVTSTAFWGVDRTADSLRLGGLRASASGMSKEELILRTGDKLGRVGARPTVVLMNPLDYSDLKISMGNRVEYSDIKGEMGLGFTGLRFTTTAGNLVAVADTNVKYGTAFMLDLSTWKLIHMGGLPHIVTDDGLQARALDWSNADGIEVKVRAFYNIVCNAPGHNARLTF
jgi:hypothetical protein